MPRYKVTLFVECDKEDLIAGTIVHALENNHHEYGIVSMTWEETQVPNKNNNKDTNDEMCKL